jgi:hypothetical protein
MQLFLNSLLKKFVPTSRIPFFDLYFGFPFYQENFFSESCESNYLHDLKIQHRSIICLKKWKWSLKSKECIHFPKNENLYVAIHYIKETLTQKRVSNKHIGGYVRPSIWAVTIFKHFLIGRFVATILKMFFLLM